MHQHTGNWPGKTVSNAVGTYEYKNKKNLLVDIPGTYSLMSNSDEEEIARNYICFGKADATIVVVDATCLERNLNLVYQIFEITKNVILCVNLLDEAKKKGIYVDLNMLSKKLGVPVVGVIARKPNTLKKLIETINNVCSNKIVPEPQKIKYKPSIENTIYLVSSEVQKINRFNPYLNRWISLKLIENEQNIVSSIEKYTNINFSENESINLKLDESKSLLKKNDINNENIKDITISSIISKAEEISNLVCSKSKKKYLRDKKIDKILTSKAFGIPIMILFLGLIFWLTIVGANYPSKALNLFFDIIKEKLLFLFYTIHCPKIIINLLIDGMYKTVTWVISVMLPPMAIFFPIFTILEDLGYLPRIAFNLDKYFKKACTSGKQALTMCMGFGCNAAGVVGCRIINSPRERLIAIITNAFVPCNGRFPLLICISSIFIGSIANGIYGSLLSTLAVLGIVILGIFMTLITSKFLSKTFLKGYPSSFILELPPYRKPQIGKVLIRSVFDRTLFVLGRAISVAAPAGIIIWFFANIHIGELSILSNIANFLSPFAKLIGLDGFILTAFILGIPANEIVLPIILMSYMSSGNLVSIEDNFIIGNILLQNGWTLLTAINVMIFTLLHFPCSTTLLTIKKESGSWKWVILSFLLPTICGIVLCFITTCIWNIFI